MDLTLADKVLKKTSLDLQKRFPIYHACPKYLAAYRCGSDPHFDKFPTPATFACWKIIFKTEVCTCSQFHTEAMLWIKEVEVVDSVNDFMSSSSISGIQMPNFEVLDAKIASGVNKIIHNSHFKRRTSLEAQKAQNQDRFLRGKQIAYLDL